MNFKVILAAAALLATQSFAIIGIGGHYAPGFGTKMKAGPVLPVTEGIQFGHEGFDGTMQGFGFKLWIDILPIIDIEATYNIQFGSYDAALYVDGVAEPLPLEIELAGTPFGKANPKFVASGLDVSITYPLTFIPVIRPYIGGGVTYHLNTFVLNQSFVQGIIDDPAISEMIKSAANKEGLDPEALQQKVQELETDRLARLLQHLPYHQTVCLHSRRNAAHRCTVLLSGKRKLGNPRFLHGSRCA